MRKSGRVPQHTRTERRQAEAERRQQRQDDRRWQARLRWAAFSVASTGVVSFICLPPAEVSSGHQSYTFLSAADLARSDNLDLPHIPEGDMTFYTSSVEAGTTRTFI